MTPIRLCLAAAALLGLGLPLASAFAQGQAPAPQAPAAAAKGATVNGVAISPARIDAIVKAQAARGVPDSPQLRDEVREQLIVREIITQEATRKGLGKNPEVQTQLDLARQQVMWNAYIADFVKSHPIPEPQLRAEYDKLKAARGDKEYKARHILLEKEDDAKLVIADLKKGRKFEELAKQSKDTGSRDRGGDLDWNSPAGYVKPFGDALTKLEKGKYTETPVQTQFGWHVILVEDIRPAKFPSFDDVKQTITEGLQKQAFERNIVELRAKAKVE